MKYEHVWWWNYNGEKNVWHIKLIFEWNNKNILLAD
jgi:hypothetical protein